MKETLQIRSTVSSECNIGMMEMLAILNCRFATHIRITLVCWLEDKPLGVTTQFGVVSEW